jgi:Janus/Ocnus family (Ocnus)
VHIVLVAYPGPTSSHAAGTALPKKRGGKFVQLRHGETEYLVLASPESASYHADIVERFCKEREIPGVYKPAGKRFLIHDPSWVIKGGGKFVIDDVRKSILFYDNSMAYGRFDPGDLKEKISSIEKWREYEVRIE